MARRKVRYLVQKGHAFYWQPGRRLRAEGWAPRRIHAADWFDAARQADALNGQLDAWYAARAERRMAAPAAPEGTVGDLVEAYRRSRFFTDLQPATRADYAAALDWMDEAFGSLPWAALTRVRLQQVYQLERRKHHRRANKRMDTIRRVFARARDIFEPGHPCHVPAVANPATGMGLVGTRPRRLLWPAAAVDFMVDFADRAGRPSIGDAILFGAWFGPNPKDLLRLPANLREGGEFVFRRSKTGQAAVLPVSAVPALLARYEAARGRNAAFDPAPVTLFVNERTGRAWNQFTFTHELAALREAAARECPAFPADFVVDGDGPAEVATVELEFRYLRHTAVTRLGEAGVPPRRIAAITGHSQKSVISILEVYTLTTVHAARAAIAQLVEHADRRREREG